MIILDTLATSYAAKAFTMKIAQSTSMLTVPKNVSYKSCRSSNEPSNAICSLSLQFVVFVIWRGAEKAPCPIPSFSEPARNRVKTDVDVPLSACLSKWQKANYELFILSAATDTFHWQMRVMSKAAQLMHNNAVWSFHSLKLQSHPRNNCYIKMKIVTKRIFHLS